MCVKADKRAHHNALERKRRDHIKDSFSGLRDSVPSLHGEKVSTDHINSNANSSRQRQASRAQILKKAAEYIAFMRRKNTAVQADIDDLKRQNKLLEEQSESRDVLINELMMNTFILVVRALEKAKGSGLTTLSDYNGIGELDSSSHPKIKSESVSSLDGVSDSDSISDGDGVRLKS